jgi:dipeptidyl aminopeptidase/acylaminoacyl peptidase
VWEGDAQRSFIDESLKELARGIDKVLPGRFNWIYGFNKGLNRYLVESTGNGIPGQFLAGDRAAGTLKVIGQRYPGLDPNQLVGKRKIKFKARDGLDSRLSDRAQGGHARARLAHGADAPWRPDLLRRHRLRSLDGVAGFARLCRAAGEFPRSDNQGRTFRDAGLKRWGMEMQDDLTDGVKWAVDNHVADAKRLCIVGASYGGYAALMGAVKTPDLYRCAVSFAGVSDLVDMSREWSGWKGDKAADKQLGNYWNDRDNLKKTSPANHAAEIHIPVLLVHGRPMPRCPTTSRKPWTRP